MAAVPLSENRSAGTQSSYVSVVDNGQQQALHVREYAAALFQVFGNLDPCPARIFKIPFLGVEPSVLPEAATTLLLQPSVKISAAHDRVICALAQQFQLRYCPQVPNLALILLHAHTEAETFAVIRQLIAKSRTPGTDYAVAVGAHGASGGDTSGLPWLQLSQSSERSFVRVFRTLVKALIPALHVKMEGWGSAMKSILASVFRGFFTGFLPPPDVRLLVHEYRTHGPATLLRYALALLKLCRGPLTACNSASEFDSALRSYVAHGYRCSLAAAAAASDDDGGGGAGIAGSKAGSKEPPPSPLPGFDTVYSLPLLQSTAHTGLPSIAPGSLGRLYQRYLDTNAAAAAGAGGAGGGAASLSANVSGVDGDDGGGGGGDTDRTVGTGTTSTTRISGDGEQDADADGEGVTAMATAASISTARSSTGGTASSTPIPTASTALSPPPLSQARHQPQARQQDNAASSVDLDDDPGAPPPWHNPLAIVRAVETAAASSTAPASAAGSATATRVASVPDAAPSPPALVAVPTRLMAPDFRLQVPGEWAGRVEGCRQRLRDVVLGERGVDDGGSDDDTEEDRAAASAALQSIVASSPPLSSCIQFSLTSTPALASLLAFLPLQPPSSSSSSSSSHRHGRYSSSGGNGGSNATASAVNSAGSSSDASGKRNLDLSLVFTTDRYTSEWAAWQSQRTSCGSGLAGGGAAAAATAGGTSGAGDVNSSSNRSSGSGSVLDDLVAACGDASSPLLLVMQASVHHGYIDNDSTLDSAGEGGGADDQTSHHHHYQQREGRPGLQGSSLTRPVFGVLLRGGLGRSTDDTRLALTSSAASRPSNTGAAGVAAATAPPPPPPTSSSSAVPAASPVGSFAFQLLPEFALFPATDTRVFDGSSRSAIVADAAEAMSGGAHGIGAAASLDALTSSGYVAGPPLDVAGLGHRAMWNAASFVEVQLADAAGAGGGACTPPPPAAAADVARPEAASPPGRPQRVARIVLGGGQKPQPSSAGGNNNMAPPPPCLQLLPSSALATQTKTATSAAGAANTTTDTCNTGTSTGGSAVGCGGLALLASRSFLADLSVPDVPSQLPLAANTSASDTATDPTRRCPDDDVVRLDLRALEVYAFVSSSSPPAQ